MLDLRRADLAPNEVGATVVRQMLSPCHSSWDDLSTPQEESGC